MCTRKNLLVYPLIFEISQFKKQSLECVYFFKKTNKIHSEKAERSQFLFKKVSIAVIFL